MATIRNHSGRAMPTKNHLAMYINGPTQGATGILPETGITIVEVEGKEPHLFPLILKSVSHREFHLVCACGKDECTRGVRFKGSWYGQHPYREGEPQLNAVELDV